MHPSGRSLDELPDMDLRVVLDWFVAPAGSPPARTRRAGLRSFAAGVVLVVLAFVLALHDARWFGGAILRTRARLVLVAVVLGGYLVALQGLYRAIRGAGRADDSADVPRVAQVASTFAAVVGIVALFPVLFFAMAAVTPEPPATHTIDIPIGDLGAGETRIPIGDAMVTITPVPHTAAH